MAHSPEVIEEVLKRVFLLEQGNAQVAREVLGSSSKESTVRYIRSMYESDGSYNGVSLTTDEPPVDETPDWYVEEGELDALAGSPDYDVASLAKKLRNAQRTNNQLRKINNSAIDPMSQLDQVVEGIQRAVKGVKLDRWDGATLEFLSSESQTNATIELLFSDFQIGKIGQYYNSELAEKAIIKYGKEVLRNLERNSKEYKYERIVLAMLGDTVEDHLKHGVQSATSTDSGLAEQIATATRLIWKHVIKPLAQFGLPMEVICIAGNHGSSQHKGFDMYKAGLFSYDYPIYRALELLTSESGYDKVKFVIPEGVFAYTSFYGNYAVYEHGYFNAPTEKSIEDQKKKRSQQMKKHVEYMRVGDNHHVCSYDCHRLVLNGAFFGKDSEGVEYAGILGFDSTPAQAMMIHTDEKSLGRNTVKEFITIQVADGY